MAKLCKPTQFASLTMGERLIGQIPAIPVPAEKPLTKTRDLMEYYYRRGDKYYFRGHFGRLVVTLIDFSEASELIRGHKYIMTY